MPTCCIKNCKNRTNHNGTKGIKYFTFLKETSIRQQWLNACQRKETDMKVDSARICAIHFDENCLMLEKTKPRLQNKPAKEVLRLKQGSVPTLNLEKKRKDMSQSKEDNKKIKVPVKSFVPTYTELVQYAQQKQRLSREEIVINVETNKTQDMEEVAKNLNKAAIQSMEEQNKTVQQEIMQETGNNANVDVETLLMQLRNAEKRNQELLNKNKNLLEEKEFLEEKNQSLSIQVT
ncbi:uncharacterized protein [Temnothorax longispinosus]|uniref:uncharacterized protein n=1 Tax=Temnothorax longispinosus TaxID=300112 RepID=UPI003A98F1BB